MITNILFSILVDSRCKPKANESLWVECFPELWLMLTRPILRWWRGGFWLTVFHFFRHRVGGIIAISLNCLKGFLYDQEDIERRLTVEKVILNLRCELYCFGVEWDWFVYTSAHKWMPYCVGERVLSSGQTRKKKSETFCNVNGLLTHRVWFDFVITHIFHRPQPEISLVL